MKNFAQLLNAMRVYFVLQSEHVMQSSWLRVRTASRRLDLAAWFGKTGHDKEANNKQRKESHENTHHQPSPSIHRQSHSARTFATARSPLHRRPIAGRRPSSEAR